MKKSNKFESPIAKRKILSPEAKAKRRQFKAKFNIDKEKLNKDDIITILTSIESEINESIDIDQFSKKLLIKLDTNNDGYVNTNDLIEEIMNRNLESIEDEFTIFYKKINEYLHTKCEDIILKLKRLLSREWVKEQNQINKKIESIITIISEENLYEIESDLKNIGKEGENFIAKYSRGEDTKRKESDLILVKNSLKKYDKNEKTKIEERRIKQLEKQGIIKYGDVYYSKIARELYNKRKIYDPFKLPKFFYEIENQ